MTVLNSRSDGMLSLALCELPFIAKNMRDSEKNLIYQHHSLKVRKNKANRALRLREDY